MLYKIYSVRLLLGFFSQFPGALDEQIDEYLDAQPEMGMARFWLHVLLWTGLVRRFMPLICTSFRSFEYPYEKFPYTPFFRYEITEKGRRYVRMHAIEYLEPVAST